MNIQVFWGATNITTSVTGYQRQQDICTGIGTLDVTLEAGTDRAFDPWDTITVYEDGNKKGTYYIAAEEKRAPDGTFILFCQDYSKRLQDYFISDSYEITYPTSARYWIEKFLTEAGVGYTINTTGYGAPLGENTSMGMQACYDQIVNLLQLSGWYMYFDEDGDCVIGKLDLEAGGWSETFDDTELLTNSYSFNDKFLRNRAVIWGNGDPETGEWIFADTSEHTMWNRDEGDLRTVLYSNGSIKTIAIAYQLALTLLNEFSHIYPVRNISVAGSPDLTLGDRVRVVSDYTGSYTGTITDITVNVDDSGFITQYLLDKRCPRLFGYVNWGGYIYVGTQAHGVYRKHLSSITWAPYNTGITTENIRDVTAYDGLLGCTTEDTKKFYKTHTSEGTWTEYTPTSLSDITASGIDAVIASGINAEATSINRTGLLGSHVIGYSVPGSGTLIPPLMYPASGNRSWVMGLTHENVPLYTNQVYVPSGDIPNYDTVITDLECNNQGYNIVSVRQPGERPIIYMPSGDDGDWGEYFTTYGVDPLGAVGQSLNRFACDSRSYVSLPPPTSGLLVDENEFDFATVGGGWLGHYHGNFVAWNGPTSSGTFFAWYKTNTSLGSGILSVDLAEWAGDSFTRQDYYTDIDVFDDPTEIEYFYKIDDSNYSFVSYNQGVDAYSEPIFTLSYKVFNIETSTFTTETDTVVYVHDSDPFAAKDDTIRVHYPSMNSTERAVRGASGKFYACMYLDTYDPPKVYLVILNMSTGQINYQYIDQQFEIDQDSNGGVWDYNIIAATMPQSTPNYLLFSCTKRAVIVTDADINERAAWEATTTVVCLNNQTGESTIESFTDGQSLGGGTVQGFTTPFAEDTDYLPLWLTPAFENPDSGTGLAKLGISMRFTIAFKTPNPGEDSIERYHVVNISLPSAEIAEQTGSYWERYVEDGAVISDTIPAWVYQRSNGDAEHYFAPTFSRWHSSTPVITGRYMHQKIFDTYINAFISPYDFGSYQTISISNGGELCPSSPMLDDFDGTIYCPVSYDSNAMDIYGFDVTGNHTKTLFDSPYSNNSDSAYTVIHNLLIDNEIADTGPPNYYDEHYIFYARQLKAWTLSGVKQGIWDYVLRHDPSPASGQFDIVHIGTNPLYLDTARDIPTVIYEKPPSGYGPTYSGSLPDYLNSDFLGTNWTNVLGDTESILPMAPILDARTFDLVESGSLPVESGSFSNPFGRYIGLANYTTGLRAIDATLQPDSEYVTLKTFPGSGEVTHLDFTNTHVDPYIMVSVGGGSGVAGGSGTAFYQRDPGFDYVEVSTGLPASQITVIRVDDKV